VTLNGEISTGAGNKSGYTNIQLLLRQDSSFHSSPKPKITQINYLMTEVPYSTDYFISCDCGIAFLSFTPCSVALTVGKC